MSRLWIAAVISLFLAGICWFGELATYPSSYETVLVLSAVCFSLLFICLLSVGIVKQIRKDISPYRVFAVTDIVIGTGAFFYAVYDLITTADSAFFPD